jgi:hypothetical protein
MIDWLYGRSGNPYHRGSTSCTVYPCKWYPGRWTYLLHDDDGNRYSKSTFPTMDAAMKHAEHELEELLKPQPHLTDEELEDLWLLVNEHD